MDARSAYEYHGARIAPVAQLDRVLPSEGSGRGFESRLVHHIVVSSCLQMSTKLPAKPAPCGLCCFWLSPAVSPYNLTPCIPGCIPGQSSN